MGRPKFDGYTFKTYIQHMFDLMNHWNGNTYEFQAIVSFYLERVEFLIDINNKISQIHINYKYTKLENVPIPLIIETNKQIYHWIETHRPFFLSQLGEMSYDNSN